MLGILVGTVSLIALVRLLRHGRGACGGRFHHHHRRYRGDCSHGRGRWHDDDRGFDDGGFDDRGFDDGNRVVFLRALFTRLETTPGQERVVVDALKELKAAFAKAKTSARKSTRDLADALEGEQLSVDAMGAVFASLDEGTAAVRDGAFSALTKIHEVLDPRQRRLLADLVKRGGGLEDLASAV